ncbi:MAG: hypothetical protein LBV45_03855 [Xanthomonadaceae bacterium]|jgi:hypothetical protein|nr:hypothetical protein [Xanthomonadaceae bacterium]
MTLYRSLPWLLVLGLACPVHAEEPAKPAAELRLTEQDAASADLPALIECRQGVREFLSLMPALKDPLRAVALGWQPLPRINQFMTEYRLQQSITVFGHATDRIAFSGGSVMALLDLPDPRPLAARLELETAIDTPEKAMFGREVRSDDLIDPETGEALIESVILSISNVDSHPGKTLVGCNYSLDHMESEEESVPATETSPPSALPSSQDASNAAADR